ncbi:hypothetical protein DT73_18955 [Mangrovibacter sp. MFB070]|nr:hypothetical protein DT73_18955 [Mangrovibacter sp. MFB070]
MTATRRQFLIGLSALTLLKSPLSFAKAPATLNMKIFIRSPWMVNQVALTSKNQVFLGAPRYARNKSTPSLVRQEKDGSLKPFPGNQWNEWQPGKDAANAFVYLNSVHIFDDDTVWCVDQGSLNPGVFSAQEATLQPGAQKIIRLEPDTGEIINIIRFDNTILPPGAQMNDLRLHQSVLYISDSGVGAIIIHDLQTGKTLRRLSGMAVVRASDKKPPSILDHIKGGKSFNPPQSDLIEITQDGKWLYWASPTGPLYRAETRFLRDESLSDAQLAAKVEKVFDNNFSGGCCMDSQGNVYFSETARHVISVYSPSGQYRTLVEDPRLNRPDGTFISKDRKLYIPEKVPLPDDRNSWAVFVADLPGTWQGIPLGGAVASQ